MKSFKIFSDTEINEMQIFFQLLQNIVRVFSEMIVSERVYRFFYCLKTICQKYILPMSLFIEYERNICLM